MSKFFSVVLAVLFVVAAAAPLMATDARQEAMAFVGNYIEDDYNIFTWYATLPSYSNTVWIGIQDLNRGDNYNPDMFYYLGASYGLGSQGKKGTIAMFLYDYSPGLNPYNELEWEMGDAPFSRPLDNKFTLMYAYPMDKITLGLYFSRSDESGKNEGPSYNPTEEFHYAYTTVGAGIRFDVGDKAYTDLAFDINMGGYKDNYNDYYGYGNVSDDANKLYRFRGRMFYQWSDKITWVPFVSFQTFDFRLKADSAEAFARTHFGDKGNEFTFGIGANIKVNEDNLLIFALEPFDYSKVEPSQPPAGENGSITSTVLPKFYLALESDVKNWLTFRVGASKDLYKEEGKHEVTGEKPTKSTYTGADFAFYMGLGFHVAQFDIDAVLNPELPMHLGYWLTGYSPNYGEDGGAYNEPVYVVSATYHF